MTIEDSETVTSTPTNAQCFLVFMSNIKFDFYRDNVMLTAIDKKIYRI